MKRETALELYRELDQKPPLFTAKTTLIQDPEEVAGDLRKDLGGDADPVKGDARQHFNRWRSALESAGVLVFQAEKIGIDEMRGFSITERPLPVVVVNIKDAPPARNFSLFHEAAHVLLGNGGLCNLEESHGGAQQKIESFCNHVAGAALVPAEILLGLSDTPKQRVPDLQDDASIRLARFFGVSQEVILRRLVTLGRLPLPYYLKKREEFRKRHPASQHKKGGFASPSTMALATNGRLFTRLVLDAYGEEKIGTSDILEFLGVRPKQLDQIKKAILEPPAEEWVEQ